MRLSETAKGYIAAVLYSAIIGFSFLAVKTSLVGTSTPVLLSHRFTTAFIGACVVAAVRKIHVGIRLRDYFTLLPLLLTFPVAYLLFQSLGLEHAPSSMAGILQAAAPVFSAIFAALLLRERAARVQVAGIALTIAGVALLSLPKGGGGGSYALYGSLMLLISAMAYGLFSVLSRKLSRSYPAFVLTFWMVATGFVLFNLYAALHLAGKPIELYLQPLRSPGYVVAVLYLGLLSLLGSSFLSNYALARMEATKMTVFTNLATVISVAAGILVLQEPFHVMLLAGMCVIVVGVLLVNRGKAVSKVEESAAD